MIFIRKVFIDMRRIIDEADIIIECHEDFEKVYKTYLPCSSIQKTQCIKRLYPLKCHLYIYESSDDDWYSYIYRYVPYDIYITEKEYERQIQQLARAGYMTTDYSVNADEQVRPVRIEFNTVSNNTNYRVSGNATIGSITGSSINLDLSNATIERTDEVVYATGYGGTRLSPFVTTTSYTIRNSW